MTIQKYANLNTLIAVLSLCIIIAYFNKEFGKAQQPKNPILVNFYGLFSDTQKIIIFGHPNMKKPG